jgi:hypothetical protein
MKKRTRQAYKALQNALLCFPPGDLLELTEFLLNRFSERMNCPDWEDEIKLSLGWKLKPENASELFSSFDELVETYGDCIDWEWIPPSALTLHERLATSSPQQLGPFVELMVEACNIPKFPLGDYRPHLESLAQKLQQTAFTSDRPSLLAKLWLSSWNPKQLTASIPFG